jgi:hypothetical protein
MKEVCARELNDCFESVKKMLEKRRIERQLNEEGLEMGENNNKLEAVYKSIKGLRASIKNYFDSKETTRPSQDTRTNFKSPNKTNPSLHIYDKDYSQTEEVSIRF